MKYLQCFFKFKKSSKNFRKQLQIPLIFSFLIIKNRIRRFKWAIENLLSSELYPKYALKSTRKIEVKRQCSTKVHEELKVMNIFMIARSINVNILFKYTINF